MSILSIAVYGTNLFFSFNNQELHRKCSVAREISEVLLDMVREVKSQHFDILIFSSGPGSFTTMKVIGSAVRGIKLCAPHIKIISMSTFCLCFQ